MKRCPECYHVYDDEERFCETDGQELLADPAPSPKPEVVVTAAPARPVWWPAAAVGIVIGIVFGAGVFGAALMFARPESNERPVATPPSTVHERVIPGRVVAASSSAPAPAPEASPSPVAEQQPANAPSPAPNTETK